MFRKCRDSMCEREGSAPEKLQDYLEREGAAGSDGKTWEKKRERRRGRNRKRKREYVGERETEGKFQKA